MNSSTILIDNHHAFGDLATQYPWLARVEARARNAQVETFDDLHTALTWVHVTCATYLPHPHSTVADCHLGKVLDDQAALHWQEATS